MTERRLSLLTTLHMLRDAPPVKAGYGRDVVEAFLLSREWRDADDGVEVTLWARAASGPVRVRLTRQEPVMFVPRSTVTHDGRRVPRELSTLSGAPVDAVYFRSQRALVEERDRLRAGGESPFESDVKPSDRYVMERFVTGGLAIDGKGTERRGILTFDNPRIRAADVRPELSLVALDIETDGFEGPVISAAVAMRDHERVIVRGPRPDGFADDRVRFVADERALLVGLFAELVAIDADVICGWNITEFDLTRLDERARALGVPFAIGRGGERARVLAGRTSIARVPGRVVLDGIATLKSATHSFERFTLGAVAGELLGRGKKIATGVDPVAEIRRMWTEDFGQLVAYNLEDCRLVLDIFAKADLLGFAIERARLTGLAMDRPGGSVAAFDHLYLPRLHRRGVVAPDVGGGEAELVASPGGHVLDSVPGLHHHVLAFDFRSLYPSIIRTFQIDPLALARPGHDAIPGEEGATFAREGAILPELIAMLHDARTRARDAGNEALSRAIKIVMNSFYGVLGTPGCRFFDARLPTSITRRGHQILSRAGAYFAGQGLEVIYGDTDSLFVRGDPASGPALAAELNALLAAELRTEYGVESHLELRFDAHYSRFLMPTTRGTDRGSKKRYAGLTSKGLVLRGLEAVRRDWTPLARRVQTELLRRVFVDEPFEEWLRGIADDLAAGRIDEAELVYRRRESEHVVTTLGPELPGGRTAPIDTAHYLAKQLAPVCDVVLPFLGTSFERIAGKQTSLF